MSVAGVVLAAGASTRLGRPKQTVVLAGETLVERAARVATEAGLSPLIVVVRPGAAFADALRGCVVVPNEDADEGMAASIRHGILALRNVAGAVVMTCDQAMLRPEHLQALCADADEVKGSRYAGRVGVPAYFPATVFDQLMKLKGDAGARDLLRAAEAVTDETLALDIDTESDLKRAHAQIEYPS